MPRRICELTIDELTVIYGPDAIQRIRAFISENDNSMEKLAFAYKEIGRSGLDVLAVIEGNGQR